MKKIFILLLACIFCLDQSFAQVIILKKGEGYNDMQKYYRFDTNITIKITGYNPFATKLNGKGVDIDLSYETPDLFNSIGKAPVPEQIIIPPSTPTDFNQDSLIGGGKTRDATNDLTKKSDFVNSYKKLISNTQKIYLLYHLEDHIKKIISDPTIEFATSQNNINSLIESLIEQKNPRSEIIKLFECAKENYTDLKFNYDILNKSLDTEKHFVTGTLKDKNGDFEVTLKDAAATVKRKKLFQEEYDYATKIVGQLMQDTTMTNIVYNVNRAMDLREQIKNTPWELVYVVGPLPEDVKEISLKVTNVKDETILDYGKFYIHSYGQLKVDVSAGYFLSLSGNEKYTAVPDNTGKLMGIKKQKTELVNHALGIQFNFYRKPKNEIAWGGSAGFSIPVDGNLNFYLGPSILFNSKSRIILTAGIAATRLRILDSGNLQDTTGNMQYSFINQNDTEIKYNDTYRLRPFVSITYNLAAVKKD